MNYENWNAKEETKKHKLKVRLWKKLVKSDDKYMSGFALLILKVCGEKAI